MNDTLLWVLLVVVVVIGYLPDFLQKETRKYLPHKLAGMIVAIIIGLIIFNQIR